MRAFSHGYSLACAQNWNLDEYRTHEPTVKQLESDMAQQGEWHTDIDRNIRQNYEAGIFQVRAPDGCCCCCCCCLCDTIVYCIAASPPCAWAYHTCRFDLPRLLAPYS